MLTRASKIYCLTRQKGGHVVPSRRSVAETPPDLPPEKAHKLLKSQLSKLQDFKGRSYQEAEALESEWYQLTAKLVMRSFGSGSPNYSNFRRASSAGQYVMQIGEYVDHRRNQSNFEARTQAYGSALNRCISELEADFPDPVANVGYEPDA